MDFSQDSLKFAKDLPGADTVFQPPDLADYENDAWDIRISIGDAPLEEAFYIEVKDPDAAQSSIETLLDKYALNPSRQGELEVEEFPDLPFLQEELIQLHTNERKGLIELAYYVNHNTSPGPVSIQRPAWQYMSVCTYHDRSHDYRLLDLVIVPVVPELPQHEMGRKLEAYGDVYLLMLLDHHFSQGSTPAEAFLEEPPVAAYLSTWPDTQYAKFVNAMKELERNGYIQKNVTLDGTSKQSIDANAIEITSMGKLALEKLAEVYKSNADYYDQFGSISIAPPALGVPGGFDARVQMMEFDGLEFEKNVLIQVLYQQRDEIFALGNWHDAFKEFLPFQTVRDALAYKTNFSSEVLTELKRLAGDAT